MKCPHCGCSWISVLESRHTNAKAISRRRKCKVCDHVWATAEVSVPDDEWGYKATARPNRREKAEFGVKAGMLERLQAA
nr:probable transcriptional regulator NrdR [uncultured Mediterranean phage uvMED]